MSPKDSSKKKKQEQKQQQREGGKGRSGGKVQCSKDETNSDSAGEDRKVQRLYVVGQGKRVSREKCAFFFLGSGLLTMFATR